MAEPASDRIEDLEIWREGVEKELAWWRERFEKMEQSVEKMKVVLGSHGIANID